MVLILIVVIVILSGLVLIIIREPALRKIGDYLIIHDDLKPADVLHVISGPDFRTDYAILLFKKDLTKKIFSRVGGVLKSRDFIQNMVMNEQSNEGYHLG